MVAKDLDQLLQLNDRLDDVIESFRKAEQNNFQRRKASLVEENDEVHVEKSNEADLLDFGFTVPTQPIPTRANSSPSIPTSPKESSINNTNVSRPRRMTEEDSRSIPALPRPRNYSNTIPKLPRPKSAMTEGEMKRKG